MLDRSATARKRRRVRRPSHGRALRYGAEKVRFINTTIVELGSGGPGRPFAMSAKAIRFQPIAPSGQRRRVALVMDNSGTVRGHLNGVPNPSLATDRTTDGRQDFRIAAAWNFVSGLDGVGDRLAIYTYDSTGPAGVANTTASDACRGARRIRSPSAGRRRRWRGCDTGGGYFRTVSAEHLNDAFQNHLVYASRGRWIVEADHADLPSDGCFAIETAVELTIGAVTNGTSLHERVSGTGTGPRFDARIHVCQGVESDGS